MVAGDDKPFPIEGPLQFDAAVDPEVAKVRTSCVDDTVCRSATCTRGRG
jgi:phosphotransacetylase